MERQSEIEKGAFKMISIKRDTLETWKDECEGKDVKTSMLIEQLLVTYKQLDSAIAQKNAVIKASADLMRDLSHKDAHIASLINAAGEQQESINRSIQAFRKIYEISVYGNEIFKSEPLMRLWEASERFVGSTTQTELSKNSIVLNAVLAELGDNPALMDMRLNLVAFTDFINAGSQDESGREEDISGDNAESVEKSVESDI